MVPAYQCFEANDAAIDEVQPWLVMQFQLVAAQGAAQFAFKVSQAACVAVDPLVEHMKAATLHALGLAHGDVRVPHQWVGAGLRASMGQTQAAAHQQAFAIDPVRLTQRFDDALGHPFGAVRLATGVDQQGEFVAAQPGQLIARLQLQLEPGHHLQDQPVAALMAERIVDVAKVVQIQMAKSNATAVVFGQARGQQGLKALTVGDAGQRVLFGQALQGGDQHAALAHMTQRAAQAVTAQLRQHQPVTDAGRRRLGLVVEQDNGRQLAAARGRQQRRRCQHHRLTVMGKQAVDRLPVGRGQQHGAASQRLQAVAQAGGPLRLIGQQQQTQGFDRRGQARSLGEVVNRDGGILPQEPNDIHSY